MNVVKTAAKKSKYPEGFGLAIKKDFKINKMLYLMILPVVAFYLIFYYAPLYGAIIAFKDFSPRLGIIGSPWADNFGMKHFMDFLTSPSFFSILWNTIRISFTTLVFSFPAPIIFALLLNELRSPKFAKIIQNITYLPHFISLVVICGMVKDFTMNDGVIVQFMSLFGFQEKTLLNYPEYFLPVYVTSNIWAVLGWESIVYLAALTGVDQALYEAAKIDGANRFQQLLSITLPSIAPTIIIMLILAIGNLLNVGHEKILLLYNDATRSVADVISTYVYRRGLIELNWSFSTAVGLFNSVVNFIFVTGANAVSKRVSDTSLW